VAVWAGGAMGELAQGLAISLVIFKAFFGFIGVFLISSSV
jgi:hypothetical protein